MRISFQLYTEGSLAIICAAAKIVMCMLIIVSCTPCKRGVSLVIATRLVVYPLQKLSAFL